MMAEYSSFIHPSKPCPSCNAWQENPQTGDGARGRTGGGSWSRPRRQSHAYMVLSETNRMAAEGGRSATMRIHGIGRLLPYCTRRRPRARHLEALVDQQADQALGRLRRTRGTASSGRRAAAPSRWSAGPTCSLVRGRHRDRRQCGSGDFRWKFFLEVVVQEREEQRPAGLLGCARAYPPWLSRENPDGACEIVRCLLARE